MDTAKAMDLDKMEVRSDDDDESLTTDDEEDDTEIHYGPGFVSRLKSRYLSATSSTTTSSATRTECAEVMRRTASLENFVEKDKDEDCIELRQSKSNANEGSNVRHEVDEEERESKRFVKNRCGRVPLRPVKRNPIMARAQSVEVLQHEEQLQQQGEREREQQQLQQQQQVRSSVSGLRRGSRSSAEVFLNDHMAVDELRVVETSRSSSSETSNTSTSRPSAMSASQSGRWGSSGIADRELPAPDIVKETRKIFELRSGGKALGPFHQHRTLPLFIQAKASNSAFTLTNAKDEGDGNNNINNHKGNNVVSKNNAVVNTDTSVNTNWGSRSKASKTNSIPLSSSSKPVVPTKPSHLNRKTVISKANSVEAGSDGSFVIPRLRRVAQRATPNHIDSNTAKVGPKASVAFSAGGGTELRNNNRPGQSGTLERQVGVIRPMIHEQVREQERNEQNLKNDDSDIEDQTKVLKEVLLIEPQLLPPKIKAWVDSNERRSAKNSLVDRKSGEKDVTRMIAVKDSNGLKGNDLFKEPNVLKENKTNNNTKKDVPDAEYREKWKRRNEAEQHTMVFNFVNSKKAISHIENDGRDIASRSHTKRKKKQQQLLKDSGIVLLNDRAPPLQEDDEDTDSDVDVHRPVPPCNVTFIGANARTGGKSSMRSKSRSKKMSITFSASLTQIHEYHDASDVMGTSNSTPNLKHLEESKSESESGRLKSNSFLNGQGGLGSYTPSKVNVDSSQLQLGMNGAARPSSRKSPSTSLKTKKSLEDNVDPTLDSSVVSWSSSSSDILF